MSDVASVEANLPAAKNQQEPSIVIGQLTLSEQIDVALTAVPGSL